jgi:hypothetical protein
MTRNQGSDPIDSKVPTPDEVAEDERFIEAFGPTATAALTEED